MIGSNRISNSTAHGITARLQQAQEAQRKSEFVHHLQTKVNHKRNRRRLVRTAFVLGNTFVLAITVAIVFVTTHSSDPITTTKASAVTIESAANPLDQLSSANIALTVAQMSGLQEVNGVRAQAITESYQLSVAAASDSVVAKPQIVATNAKTKQDIVTYKTVQGDTISSIADKFGVTSDSIRWSNNLNGDTVSVGQVLTIPPITGIVYTVAAGDTPDSIAQKFSASKDKIIAFNDAEITGLKPGTQIIVPDGVKAAPVAPKKAVAATASAISWGYSPVYGSNGYDYGYCTWYVASRISVPSNWGNANTWDNLAPYSGWTVSSVPVVGAIAQTDAGYLGHVAIVEAVSADGTQIKYSDMNGLRGWGQVGYSDWVPVSHFPHYIYR